MNIDYSVTPLTGSAGARNWALYTVVPESNRSTESILTIFYRARVATWRDRVLLTADSLISADAGFDLDDREPFHTVNLDGYARLPELTDDQCLVLALGAFTWADSGDQDYGRRGLDRLDAHRLFTWNGFSHVDAVLFDPTLEPVVSWLSFLSAVHYQRLSLELVVGLAKQNHRRVNQDLFDHYTPGMAYRLVGRELVHAMLGVGVVEVSERLTDTTFWYAYRAGAMFVSRAALSSGVDQRDASEQVEWVDIDPLTRSHRFDDDPMIETRLVCDDPVATLSTDDYEFFAPMDDVLPPNLDTSGLDDQGRIDLECLVDRLLETRLPCFALEAKDGLDRLMRNGEVFAPVFFLDASSAFVPVPKGFFASLSTALAQGLFGDRSGGLAHALTLDSRSAYNDPVAWDYLPNDEGGGLDGRDTGRWCGDHVLRSSAEDARHVPVRSRDEREHRGHRDGDG